MDYRNMRLPHLRVSSEGVREPFRNPVGGGGELPTRDRGAHAAHLRSQYDRARDEAFRWLAAHAWIDAFEGPAGIYVEFSTAHYAPEAFEVKRSGIDVVSAIDDADKPGVTRVTVFIPANKSDVFADKLARYAAEDTPKGKPKFQNFAERVESISFRSPLSALWTDEKNALPTGDEPVWWEVWLRDRYDDVFEEGVEERGFPSREGVLHFFERTVRLVRCSPIEMEELLLQSGAVAELRRPPTVPSILFNLDNVQQNALAEDILGRVVMPDAAAGAVCILDSGINEGHPLLSNLTTAALSFSNAWGTHDGCPGGHGTQLAGLALYGDLADPLMHGKQLFLTHFLESVKVMPDDGTDDSDPALYGVVFRDSMRLAEASALRGTRVFCSATTSGEWAHPGTPTSWSAQIDLDCFEPNRERLFIISAGNMDEGSAVHAPDYDDNVNDSASIFDPAQAWNALTIGAYTDRVTIADADYAGWTPIAPVGGLCPQSTTSVFWQPQWPVKPDVVFEGGNFASQPGEETARALDDLMLISTNSEYADALFTSFGCTSGATALAAQMCGQLRSRYPELWPETIRGLVVHSAEWTEEMLKSFGDTVDDRRRLLNRYGYGVPNIDRASDSRLNEVTMVLQGSMQPFVVTGDSVRSNEIVFHKLPWPKEALQGEPDATARMRVTLSYYIEPNPGRRGYRGRYSYASHGLRFEMQKHDETFEEFQSRVNALDREDEYENPGGDSGWTLKQKARNRGSVISDIWNGSAIDLAQRSAIAIFPTSGWWKGARSAGKADSVARYSLLVGMSIDSASIDIYSPIATEIGQALPIELAQEVEIEDEGL